MTRQCLDRQEASKISNTMLAPLIGLSEGQLPGRDEITLSSAKVHLFARKLTAQAGNTVKRIVHPVSCVA
jgi:hypothetical protein